MIEKHLNQYNVIFLNMQRFLNRAVPGKMIELLEGAVINELKEAYGEYISGQTKSLAVALEEIYARSKSPFIFLIDVL